MGRGKSIFFILFLLIIIGFQSFSQRESANWYFGYHAGITFNTSPPSALTNGAMYAFGGCSSISDKNGNLLFYTNGNTIFNKIHDTMLFGTGLMGDFTYGNYGQSVIIVPRPGTPNYYYIFAVNRNNYYNPSSIDALRFSAVSTYLVGGLGAVIVKNHVLLQKTLNAKITAVKHRNNRDYWVIVHEENSTYFYSFLVTSGGIQLTPVVSSAGRLYNNNLYYYWWNGQIKVSPDGKKLAMTHNNYYYYYYGQNQDSVACEVFNFDNSTGRVTNGTEIKKNTFYTYYYLNSNGIEFSPDGRQLYMTENSNTYYYYTYGYNIYQYDLYAGNQTAVNNSRQLIGQSKNTYYYYSGIMQLGPDGRIYTTKYYSHYLGVINSPNQRGAGCCYQDSGIYLGGTGYSMNGLPNYPTDFFNIPEVEIENTCFGDTTSFKFNLNGCIDSVRWNFDDPASGIHNISRLFNPVHVFTRPDTYNVKLYKFRQTKTDTSTWVVIIHPLPVADFTVNDSIQCFNGNRFQFTDASNVPSGSIDTFLWSFSEGLPATVQNPVYSYNNTGNFLVSLVTTTNHGCKDTTSMTVSILPSPKADFSVNNNIQCLPGNQFNFTNTSNKSVFTNLTSIWHDGQNTADSSLHHALAYNAAGFYNCKLVVVNEYNCEDSLTKKMTVSDLIAGFNINDTNQCLDGNRYLLTDLTSNFPTDSFVTEWLPGDATKFFSRNLAYTYKLPGNFLLKQRVTDIYGCRDSTLVNVTVYPASNASFTINDDRQCLKGNSFDFSSPANPSDSYTWNLGDGNTSGSPILNWRYNSADTFNVVLITVNSFGCDDTFTRDVFVHPSPTPGIIVNDSVQCMGNNLFLFTHQPSVYNSLEWDFNDGVTATTPAASHHYSVPGIYNTRLAMLNSFGCTDTITRKMEVLPSPGAGFTVNDSIQCWGSNRFDFTLTNTSSINTCNWNFGDGNSITGVFQPFHTYLVAGNYRVKVLVATMEGCTDSAYKNLVVKEGPKASFLADRQSACLKSNHFNFTNTIIYNGGGTVNYTWYSGDGSTATSSGYNHTYANAGLYNVKLTGYSADGCADSFTMAIEVFPDPAAGFDLPGAVQCFIGNSFIFVNNSSISSGSMNALWDFDDGSTSTLWNDIHSYATEGAYLVKLITTSDKGCADTFVKKAEVIPSPLADFDFVADSCSGKVSFINKTAGYITLDWSFGDGATSTLTDPSHHYRQDGTYPVVLMANRNYLCEDMMEKTVTVSKVGVFIPSAFSPNNDGINDIFRVENLTPDCAEAKSFVISIFNRWGEKVFESGTDKLEWDGTYKQTKVPPGIYLVIVSNANGSFTTTLTVLY